MLPRQIMLSPHANPLARDTSTGPRHVAKIEQELTGLPHLRRDSRFNRRENKATFLDARAAKTAAEALGKLPDDHESRHMVISGRFALFDYVPAVLALAGCTIDRVTIATLGFSRRNIEKLCKLVDQDEIHQTRLLCSHYFAGTSATIYDHAVAEFHRRPERMQFLSVRTHAKILLVGLSDGRRLTIESSANLRSCKNIEQATAFADAGLYDFHTAWIDSLFAGASNADA